MAKRLGEIILIQYPEITIELYDDAGLEIGHIVSLESGKAIGLVHTVVAVCIDEGKTTQALGSSGLTDAELLKNYPHLKNSTRRLAKIALYDGIDGLNLNQGVYNFELASQIFTDKNYWQCFKNTSLSILTKHLTWLEKSDPHFEIKK